MSHTLLNLLKGGQECKLPTPAPNGWQGDAGTVNFLDKFAKSIDTTEAAGVHDVHSVPTVFARPIIFDQAFRDASHPSHKDVIDQWRGLLAIFALQPWFGFDIQFQAYSVAGAPNGATSAVGNVPANGLHLNTMLESMLPKPAALWNPLRLINVNGFVVGAASPWTAVFTPASPSVPPSVPWKKATGTLYDPISFFGKNGKESIDLTLVHQWVTHLLSELQRERMERSRREAMRLPVPPAVMTGIHLDAFTTQLTAWQTALNDHLEQAMPFMIPGLADANPAAGPLGAFLRGSLPLRPVPMPAGTPSEVPGELGDVWLAPTREGHAPTVLLKRTGMPDLTRIHNEAFVFNVDFDKMPGASGQGFTTRGGRYHAISWIFPEAFFFPSKLTYINSTSAARTGPAAEFSVPLTPEFFRYFNHSDVSRLSIQINGTGDARILTATLNLPLRGGGVFPVQRVYSLAPAQWVDTGGVTPGFILWPDYYSENWTHNLAAYAGPREAHGPHFQAAPIFSGGGTESFSQVNGLEKPVRVWECNKPPIGFSLRDNGASAGLVLRDSVAPPPAIIPNSSWRVSVDFGTANTMISYEANGDTNIHPLEIKPRLQFLNDSPYTERLQDHIAPPVGAVPPFRTLCYNSDVTVIGKPGQTFVQRFSFIPEYVTLLVPNLKWGTNDSALRSYLTSVVRLVVCEARARGVESLRFKWSYPLALPSGPRGAMDAFWRVLQGNFSSDGLSVQTGDTGIGGQPGEIDISESEAACRALALFPGSPVPAGAEGLCVVLDIGGGSTDYAFWCRGRLLDYFSFKLAGNDVLRGGWIRKDRDFLKRLYRISTGGEATDIPVINELQPEDFNKAEMWVNHVLSLAKDKNGIRFQDGMSWLNHPAVQSIFSDDLKNKPWVNVRTLAYILLAGMTYFAGLRARAFSGDMAIPEITVVMSGRGASLCAWVSNNAGVLARLLSACFAKGYSRDNPGQLPRIQTVSAVLGPAGLPPLKSEVARGGLQRAIGSVEPPQTPILGELNWKRRKMAEPEKWDKRLEVHELSDLHPPNDSTGADCYIKELIALLETLRTGLNLDEENLNQAKLAVNWANISSALNLDATGIVQPVFAIELKALMDQYFNLLPDQP